MPCAGRSMWRQWLVCLLWVLGWTINPSGIATASGGDLTQAFRDKLGAIARDPQNEVVPMELFSSADFRELWENPIAYKEEAVELIADPTIPERLKWIAATAMLNLPLDDYLSICEVITGLRRDGKVSHELFNWTLFPMYDFSTKMVDYYQHPKLRELLQSIERLALLPEAAPTGHTLDHIEYILSGRAACDLDDFRAGGNLPKKPKPSDLPPRVCGGQQ